MTGGVGKISGLKAWFGPVFGRAAPCWVGLAGCGPGPAAGGGRFAPSSVSSPSRAFAVPSTAAAAGRCAAVYLAAL